MIPSDPYENPWGKPQDNLGQVISDPVIVRDGIQYSLRRFRKKHLILVSGFVKVDSVKYSVYGNIDNPLLTRTYRQPRGRFIGENSMQLQPLIEKIQETLIYIKLSNG